MMRFIMTFYVGYINMKYLFIIGAVATILNFVMNIYLHINGVL